MTELENEKMFAPKWRRNGGLILPAAISEQEDLGFLGKKDGPFKPKIRFVPNVSEHRHFGTNSN